MRRPIAALLTLLLVAATPVAAQRATPSDPIRALEGGLLPANAAEGVALPRWSLEERMRAYGVPGVSVAVIDGGRIAWAHAWGVRRAGGEEPVDTGTVFQAASISKPVSAVAVLSLVQEGALTLDDDVNTFLRSWTVPESAPTAGAKVTLRRLLSHTAGLTVHGFGGYARDQPVPTVVQVLDGAGPANSAPVRPDLVPGTQWRYSGGGTTVAQLLMMDVTGKPFDELLSARVLQPLNMGRSTFVQPLPAGFARNAASGHRSDGTVVVGEWHTYPEQAAAGLWTTPSDLARVALEVQRAWHGESGAILTQASAREMLTEVAGDYGVGFGLGEYAGAPTFAHGGANEGFRAHFLAWRDGGRGAFVMTNGDGGGGLAQEILRGIADLYGWPGPTPRMRATRAVAATAVARLAGTFEATRLTLRVSANGDELRVSFPDGSTRPFLAGADGRWFSPGGGPELEFADDGASVVVHGAGPEPITARRRER